MYKISSNLHVFQLLTSHRVERYFGSPKNSPLSWEASMSVSDVLYVQKIFDIQKISDIQKNFVGAFM